MKEATLLVFWTLIILASIACIAAYFVNKSIRRVEFQIIKRYREKIDKIPALVEVIKKHTKTNEAYKEFSDLHVGSPGTELEFAL